MTELDTLHRRIHSEDCKVRESVTGDDIRRYLQLQKEQDAKRAEREKILEELRQSRNHEVYGDQTHLRGVDLIARGLQGA